MGRTAQQVAWQRFGPQLLAAISCSVTNTQGRIRFNFTTEYDLVPSNANKRYDLNRENKDRWAYAAEQDLFQFVVSNNFEDPAMWWAESLMSYSWLDAALKMEVADAAQDSKKGKNWQSGSISRSIILYNLLHLLTLHVQTSGHRATPRIYPPTRSSICTITSLKRHIGSSTVAIS
jgi:hypothetical protein